MYSTATSTNRELRAQRLAPYRAGVYTGDFRVRRDPYWLSTGKISNRFFADRRRQQFEARNIGAGNPPLPTYTIALPGFSSVQAMLFAQGLQSLSSEFMVALPVYGDESFTSLVSTVLRKTKRSDLPRFGPAPPIGVGPRVWELRPIIDRDIAAERASSAVFHAFTRKKILRFVYPCASFKGELTRRVQIHSIYGVNGIPTYFKGEYEGKVKTYSLDKCSELILEEIDTEHLLPTLAIELVVTSSSKLPIVRLIQIAQL